MDAQPTRSTPKNSSTSMISIWRACPIAWFEFIHSVGSDLHLVALSINVIVLSCESTAEGGVCDVYLVGTAHVSEESSKEVQAIVDFLKPEVPTMREIVTMLKKKHNMFEVLYGWFLAKIASLRSFLALSFVWHMKKQSSMVAG